MFTCGVLATLVLPQAQIESILSISSTRARAAGVGERWAQAAARRERRRKGGGRERGGKREKAGAMSHEAWNTGGGMGDSWPAHEVTQNVTEWSFEAAI